MLHLDISGALASAITPSKGIPDRELQALATSLRRYVDEIHRERDAGEHAWAMDPYDNQAIAKVKEFAAAAKEKKIRTVVWVGIGGSGLGPKVIREAFEGPDTVEFIILDTIDPAMISMVMDIVDWEHALLVIASKSGGTLEPMSVFFLCWEKMIAVHGDKAADQTVAITDPLAGTMRSFALESGIPMLALPPKVGGRYSIFTPIGLLPLALLGGNIDEFVAGAKNIDTLCRKNLLDENPAALLAAVGFLLDTKRGYRLRVIMPYAQRLESLARWDQQLIAESLGKVETRNPIPVAAIGTQDQHSLLQQWIAGPREQWHLFIREIAKGSMIAVPQSVERSFAHIAGKPFGNLLDACFEGTRQALTSAKRAHVTIALERLDAYCLGELFFLLLMEVVLLGKLYRIDPYGQPAVEVGKQITKELLSQ